MLLLINPYTWKEIKTDFKGTVELSVSASSKLTNKLSYHWYYQAEDGETVELEEASGKNSFKVENVVKREFYYCSVDDGNESRTFSFSISVNSGLEIDYDATESYFEVDYGKSVTMETVAAANPGVELKYQWYVLDKYDVKATFFLTGNWVGKYPEDVKQIQLARHDIGNHSENHKAMSQLSKEACKEEIVSVHEKVKALTGIEMKLFRVPYGDYDDQVIRTAKACGYEVIQWSIDSQDWKDYGKESIVKIYFKKVKN